VLAGPICIHDVIVISDQRYSLRKGVEDFHPHLKCLLRRFSAHKRLFRQHLDPIGNYSVYQYAEGAPQIQLECFAAQ
jgi:hypothetical protein